MSVRPLRDLADSLRAERFFTGVQLLYTDERDRDILRMYCDDLQAAIHPVVRVHPETGEKALFVSPGSTTASWASPRPRAGTSSTCSSST